MMKTWICAAVCALLIGCQATPESSSLEQDLKLAQTALLSGHADNALSIYKQRLEANPNDSELLFLAGSACNQAGRYDQALHYLNKGNQLAPSVEFEREIGRAQLAIGNLEQASRALKNALTTEKSDDVALNSLGVTYSLQHLYPLARESFNAALSIKPDSLEYRNNLALAWMLEGKPSQGIRILYPIYQRGEASSKVRLNLALAYAMSGDVAAAKLIAEQDLSQMELENNTRFYQSVAKQFAGVAQ